MRKQITDLTVAGRVLVPGPSCKLIILQNNGAANIRLTFDGSSDTPDARGGFLPLPTSGLGYKLAAGTQWVMTLAQYASVMQRTIWGITEGGAVVLDVITDDKDST